MATQKEWICPKCGKGKILKGANAYACNYFKSLDDKCDFRIYETYFGKEITDELVEQLISVQETEVFQDLKKKDGSTFSASLFYEDGFIKPKFRNKTLEISCPICQGQIEETPFAYVCENALEKENTSCSLYISKVIAKHRLSSKELEELLTQSHTSSFISDFEDGEGENFSARLLLEEGKIIFNSLVCKCPKCGDGDLRVTKKSYSCSNWKNKSCDFSIWREISFREITPEEIKVLCEDKITPVLKGFKAKDGKKYDGKLSLNDDFKIVIV